MITYCIKSQRCQQLKSGGSKCPKLQTGPPQPTAAVFFFFKISPYRHATECYLLLNVNKTKRHPFLE